MVDTKALEKLCEYAGELAIMGEEGLQIRFVRRVIGLVGEIRQADLTACPERREMVEALCMVCAEGLGL